MAQDVRHCRLGQNDRQVELAVPQLAGQLAAPGRHFPPYEGNTAPIEVPGADGEPPGEVDGMRCPV